jgi:hypothetical protein
MPRRRPNAYRTGRNKVSNLVERSLGKERRMKKRREGRVFNAGDLLLYDVYEGGVGTWVRRSVMGLRVLGC